MSRRFSETIKLTNMVNHDDRDVVVSVEQYSSVNEVAHDCSIRPVRINAYGNFEHKIPDDTEFYGVSSYSEALDLMRYGYQPIVAKIQEKMHTIHHHPSKRVTFENNIYGFAPVVPLSLIGVPNSMVNTTIKPIKCKVIDLFYDGGATCGYSAQQMIDAGAMLLSTILNMENSGYRFNLHIADCYCDSSNLDILSVKVKDSNKPLDLKKISFPLAHSAFFRVIGFDWQSKSPAAHDLGWGRGQSIATRYKSDCQVVGTSLVKHVFGHNAVYISGEKIIDDGMDYIQRCLL